MWNIFKNNKKEEQEQEYLDKFNELREEYIIEFNKIVKRVKKYIDKINNTSHYSYEAFNGAQIIEGTYIIKDIKINNYDEAYTQLFILRNWDIIKDKILMPSKLEECNFYFIHKDYLYKYTINIMSICVDDKIKDYIELKIEKGIKILD